jgi:hypothetical protein
MAGTGLPYAIDATAAAVYRPMPGSRVSVAVSLGSAPPNSRTTVRAARESATARRLYPSPAHSLTTSETGAAARSSRVGNRLTNRANAGTTRVVCVCCSMTSLTRTR